MKEEVKEVMEGGGGVKYSSSVSWDSGLMGPWGRGWRSTVRKVKMSVTHYVDIMSLAALMLHQSMCVLYGRFIRMTSVMVMMMIMRCWDTRLSSSSSLRGETSGSWLSQQRLGGRV